MSKWIQTLLPIISLIAVAVSPVVQSYIVAHPAIAVAVASVQQIIAHWSPSPVTPAK